MVVRRGQVWWADLPEPRGSEPGYRRPVVVIQCDTLNKSRLNTVIVAALTSNLDLASIPGNVPIPKRMSKLSRDSVVNVTQILSLDRGFLSERVSVLPAEIMQRITVSLRFALGL